MKEGLERFLTAQRHSYKTALQEIQNGQKRSHWMWYIFPQIAGLGYSETAQYYAIRDMEEAKGYLRNDVLRSRLLEISQALLETESDDAAYVMGWPDDRKLKSSMTLFLLAEPDCKAFQKVLDKFFQGKLDQRTVDILAEQKKS